MKASLRILVVFAVLFVSLLTATAALAGGNAPECEEGQTVVKGHCERTGTVVGHYTTTYEDEFGTCKAIVNYRGDFGGDPYLDNGSIQNHWNCKGGSVGSDNPNASSTFNYGFYSEGEPQWDENNIWGTWDWDLLTVSGEGNVAP